MNTTTSTRTTATGTRRAALAVATVLLLGGAVTTIPAVAAPTTTTAPGAVASTTTTSCGLTWGSLAKSRTDRQVGDGTLTNVRSGRHTCYDRLVVDLAGVSAAKVGYAVSYVDAVTEPGSGREVPLAGGARLQVDVTVPAYDEDGRPTFTPRDRMNVVNVRGYDTFRQAAYAGSFEGRTTLGLGVRARLPFRVFVLDGPGSGSRLVIDVGHRW